MGLRRLARWAALAASGVAALLVAWIALYRVVDPPGGLYMWGESRRLGGITQEWVDFDAIAPVMARSVVAAEDVNFWREVDLGHVRAAVLAMDDLEAKLNAARNLRARGLTGPIVAHALHHDQQALLTEAGADCVYLTMTQAGIGLADRMQQALTI